MNNIKLVKSTDIVKITLSKPPLNILDIEDLQEIGRVFEELRGESSIRAITIESDQKVFSAGVNISDHSKDSIKKMLESFHSVFFKMLDLQIPTISLVKAGCIGGGCEFALFSDFVLASEDACFSQPEIKLGCFPPISLAYFSYITGYKKALEIILTGNKLSAREALSCNLVNQVYTSEEFDSKAQKFVGNITSSSKSVISTVLSGYKKLHYGELKKKIRLSEEIYLEELMQLEDAQEGLRSFLEKRPPIWQHK